jgi:hypothetical protein
MYGTMNIKYSGVLYDIDVTVNILCIVGLNNSVLLLICMNC